MQPKTIKEVSQRVRGFVEKAQDAAGQNNLDYSIEMYCTALKLCPEFRDARLQLRKIQVLKIKNKVSSTRQAWITAKNTLLLNVKGPSYIKKEEFGKAFEAAESVLSQDPTVPGALKLLAKGAAEADMDWLTTDTIEFLLQYHPKDLNSLRWLFDLYLNGGRGDDAISVCRKLKSLDPGNGELDTMLKNAMARQAMDQSGWDNAAGQSVGQATSSSDTKVGMSTRRPTQHAEVARDQVSADALVDTFVKDIEAGNDSPAVRKKMARALIKAERYDEAIEQLDYCLKVGGNSDPGIQNMLFQAVDARYQVAIDAWADFAQQGQEEETKAYQEISNLETQRADYRLLRSRERVLMYSNDPNVHMELALCLWNKEEIDEALIEFQRAQGSPRHRKNATLHKGKCFALKDQHDIAITEFELLLSEITEMNTEKLEAMYELAASLKSLGREEESIAQYKMIYQEDVSYRDVQEIMDNSYKE